MQSQGTAAVPVLLDAVAAVLDVSLEHTDAVLVLVSTIGVIQHEVNHTQDHLSANRLANPIGSGTKLLTQLSQAPAHH
jgi:hypothetical protein